MAEPDLTLRRLLSTLSAERKALLTEMLGLLDKMSLLGDYPDRLSRLAEQIAAVETVLELLEGEPDE